MSSADDLSALLQNFDALGEIDVLEWRKSGYCSTPTIIMVFVPRGSPSDATRVPKFYDETYEYLLECGISSLDL